jgi:hypothetical protein
VVCANRISDQATRLSDEVLPARVYHYTSTDGLLGILDSGHLWATDLRYLNDTSELHFGLTEMLSAYETVSQGPSRRESFVDRLAALYKIENWLPIGPLGLSEAGSLPRERFDTVANAIVNSLGESIIIGVTCFCGEGDLLSQWRGYGIGGYALGFDAGPLRVAVKDRYLPLTAVVYGRPPVRQILRSVSTRAEELLDDRSKEQTGAIREAVTLPLLGFAAQIKNPAFKSEMESRLGDVALGSSPLWRFRGGDLGVIPYMDIDLRLPETGRPPLREIYLAPGPEVALRAAAVRALLRSRGYPLTGRNAVDVKASKIPFRG